MEERATGLVLRTYPLTETSLIIHWLTKEQGRLATVAKGARRSKSAFRGKLDLFYLCDFSFLRSRRSELHNLKEVTLANSQPSLRHDLCALHRAAYASALIQQTTETDTPVPELFDLMLSFLQALATRSSPIHVLAFELKLLQLLGLSAEAHPRKLSAGATRLINALSQMPWDQLGRLKLSDPQSREIRQFLHGFLVYHLGKVPPGRVNALT